MCFGGIFASRKIGENKWGTSKLEENAKLDEGMQKKDLKEINMVEVVDLEALVNNSHCWVGEGRVEMMQIILSYR